jgi:hypothetical protein
LFRPVLRFKIVRLKVIRRNRPTRWRGIIVAVPDFVELLYFLLPEWLLIAQ